MEKMTLETKNLTDENIQRILELFPNVATEGVNKDGKLVQAIDFEKLKQELSDVTVDGDESYDFTWVGKKEAILEANRPIRKTLRPQKNKSLNWDTTENIYIEGDNLEALKLLQESYLGKIKMIYIDPPYNTGKDFVYRDNFTQDKESYEEELGTTDENGNRLFQNTESNGRFHSDWCSMIYSRLKLARNLLSDDGVIFISIDDNEVRNLQNICDEVFGNENFVGQLIHQRAKGGGQAKYIVKGHDYILVYGRNISNVVLSRKKVIQQKTYEIDGELYIKNDDIIRKVFGKYDKSMGDRRCFYEELVKYKGESKKQEIDALLEKGELFLEENPYGMHTICRYEKVADATSKLYSIIKVLSEEGKKDLEDLGITVFSYPKPVEIIRQLVEAATSTNSIVLDFFSGSATTAHAVMQLNAEDGGNRKFILIQLPEKTDEKSEAYKAGYKNICEIGEERIRRAGKKIQQENPDKKLDTGFRVFKVDDTNMKDVYYTPNEYKQEQLGMFESNIKDDRTDEDLLYGVLLDWGVELSLPHKVETIDGKKVHIVNEDDLIACFEDSISETVVKEIAQKQPTRVVFRDSSFKSDDERINVEEIFKLQSPNTRVKVI